MASATKVGRDATQLLRGRYEILERLGEGGQEIGRAHV